MYKLIAIDLDGTLLNSKKEISVRNHEALWKARGSGVRVVLSTARPHYRIVKYLEQLGLADSEGVAICFNGGLVLLGDGSEVLYEHHFQVDELDELSQLGKDVGFPMFAYRSDGILASADDAVYRDRNPDAKFEVRNGFNGVDWSLERIYKFALVGKPDAIRVLRGELPESLSERFEVSSSVPQFVDFVSRGISKSVALDRVGRAWGISPSQMVAFGDEDNDIPMLRFVGLSVAMGNASERVKEVAHMVTASNEDDGVARALDAILGFGE